jgi:hypothetical protein
LIHQIKAKDQFNFHFTVQILEKTLHNDYSQYMLNYTNGPTKSTVSQYFAAADAVHTAKEEKIHLFLDQVKTTG